nr:Ig-like domain-containing protein [Enterococcus sp. DIV0212c]
MSLYPRIEANTIIKAGESKKSINYQTKTEEVPPAVTDQKILSKYNLIKKFEGYSRNYDYLPWSLNSTWDGKTSDSLTNQHLTASANRGKVEFYISADLKSQGLVKTSIRTIPDHYYQLSTEITGSAYSGDIAKYALDWLSNSDVNNPVSIYSKYRELKNRGLGPTNVSEIVQAKTEEMTLVFSNGSLDVYSRAQFSKLSIVDLNQGIVESRASLEALFTDSTHTELKLSTTQEEIDKTKNLINTIVLIEINTELTNELAKAQALLDKIVMSLTIPNDLVNDPKSERSHTITGKTYPNSFVQFSGISEFPEGTLRSEVANDAKKYQIRADNEGNFSYSLPQGKYFREYETVTVFSMLRGKTASQVRIIKDLVPPEKPMLNSIKDQDSIISGKAEAGSTVNIYDKATGLIFLAGKTDANGQFSITLPADKKPMIPYKTYYATSTDAAGNSSINSDEQGVADTTAPKADAVKQALTLGDSLPTIDKMLKNISDNAGTGTDNLTIEMTKVPDVSKAGYKIAEIKLTDKAGNYLVVEVPITVKDESIVLDDTYLLKVNDFSALAIDLPETNTEREKFVLKNGQFEAWNLNSGQAIDSGSLSFISLGTLKKQPGVYPVTITLGGLSRTFKVTLLEGSLAFDKTVDKISFGTQTIQSKEQFATAENLLSISINDTRFKLNKWRLMAKMEHPLKTKDGLTSASGLLYRSYESGKIVDTKLNDLDTPVFEPSKLTNGLVQVDFTKEKEKEVILNVLPGSVHADKEYSTQIMWTLENGP